MNSSVCTLRQSAQILLVFLFILFISEECDAKYSSACSLEFSLIGSKCYHFSKDVKNWDNAYYECLSKNSSLLILNTTSEDKLMKRYLRRYNQNSEHNNHWIGGKFDWNHGSWIWGETGEPISPSIYSKTSPKDKNTLQWTCLVVESPSMHKSPRSCLQQLQYICKKDSRYPIRRKKKFNIKICKKKQLTEYHKRKCIKLVGGFGGTTYPNAPAPIIQTPKPTAKNLKEYACPPNMFIIKNRCYYFGHEKLNWHGAYWACRDKKSHLAIIRNEGQDKMLKKLLTGGLVEIHERWLGGLYDWKKAHWLWADTATPLKYKGFPFKNYVGPQFEWRGITIDPKIGNLWNARLLTERKHFICQSRARTVVKLGDHNTETPSREIMNSKEDKLDSSSSVETNDIPK